MDEQKILAEAEKYAKTVLERDRSGHDWWHIHRVVHTARKIAAEEGANQFVCQLAALLHDVADEKLHEDPVKAKEVLVSWLMENVEDRGIVSHVLEIIDTMSFKGGSQPPMRTLEGKVVQDADRLDAIGAIGIARTFAYAGAKGDLIYDPDLSPRDHLTPEEYRKGRSTSINHFYEKLLKLKDLMNTNYGKRMAEERHKFMERFLEQFYEEWEGNK